MDFADRVSTHAKRVAELKEHGRTEEATKTSLIMPFLQMLGYDSFDPRIVVPEFTADIGIKKGERVDYAIKRNGDVIMLIEAKAVGDPLHAGCASQLHRYFHCLPSAKIAILTDGVIYKFFTDLDKANMMDERPFMIFDFSAIDETLVPELQKLCNDCFDIDLALAAAQDLKYLGQFKKIISHETQTPSDELVKLFARQVYSRPITANLLESFRGHVKMAFEQNINDIITTRLKGAMQGAMQRATAPKDETLAAENASAEAEQNDRGVITTEEEKESFLIIKAILREVIDLERIAMRDTLSYCGILLDDNNRKPICRLHLNSDTVKYIETFDAEKKGTRQKIESLNDIFKFADELKVAVKSYDSGA